MATEHKKVRVGRRVVDRGKPGSDNYLLYARLRVISLGFSLAISIDQVLAV